MGPLFSPFFRQGPRGHVSFDVLVAIEIHHDGLLARSRNTSLRDVTSDEMSVQVVTHLSRLSPVFPSCHPVYSRVPNGQCLLAHLTFCFKLLSGFADSPLKHLLLIQAQEYAINFKQTLPNILSAIVLLNHGMHCQMKS